MFEFIAFLDYTGVLVLNFFKIIEVQSTNEEEVRMNLLPLLSIIALVVRIREPYVQAVFGGIFGCKSNQKVKFSSLSLNSFVNSAMNVEFVCLILNGI